MDPQFDLLQQALAGRYSLERELGRGGMGVVYLGREVMLDRPVAIKVLPPQFAASDDLRKRFLNEARTAAGLQHPNIVPVYAADIVEDWIVISMAYIDGGTVAERVETHGPLPPNDAARVIREVSFALAYAHRRGVVHRDVKPENILLDGESGRALLADFGIAKGVDSGGITSPGVLLGTPAYMSPEQASGSTVDGRSDLYSLGVVAFYLLSGQLPFSGDSPQALLTQHLTQEPPPLTTVAATVPARLSQVVDRCLAKDPGERFQSGEEVASALEVAQPPEPELAPSLAAWVGRPNELTLMQTIASPLPATLVFIVLDISVNGLLSSQGVFSTDTAYAIAIVLGPLLYVIRRTWLLRATAADGFRVADLDRALKMRDGFAGTLPSSRRDAWQRTMLSLLGASTLTIIGVLIGYRADYLYLEDLWWTFPITLSFIATTLGAWADVVYRVVRPKRSWQESVRRAFWSSRLGDILARVATIGVRPQAHAEPSGHRPTELALGGAIDVLYEMLPKQQRQRLADLPDAVERLEGAARRQRERLVELDQVAAGLGHGAVSPEAGRDDVAPRHTAAVQALASRRSEVEARLRDVVAALEVLRLDLLRLFAGGATLTSITADLEHAISLSNRIQAKAEAIDEVQGLGTEGT